MSEYRPEELDTLANLARELGVTTNAMNKWAESSRSIGFPEPAETLGRYKLYHIDEVLRWYSLWIRVNQGWKQKGTINGKR